MELESQIALVTGGTAGVGLESARLLASEGAEVVVSGRDADRGARAVAESTARSGSSAPTSVTWTRSPSW
jgi:NAD(P)-dependent dehydrogenase (short-subunit alcohol dehydrogenase family)